MRKARLLWVLLLILTATISGARAAAPPGAVEGVARDALQRPLAGVHLRLEAPDGRVVGTVSSGPGGAYRFAAVAPVVYSLVAEKEGFGATTPGVSGESDA